MTDSIFEQSLGRQLREYAEVGVRPFDRHAIAEALIKTPRPRFAWLPAVGRPALSPTMAIVVIGLLLALVAAVVVGSLILRMQVNQPPGRNGLIVYAVSDIPARPYNHLRIMNPDGSGDREVTQGTHPVYSADGKTLSFFTGWGVGESNLRIKVADADGSNVRDVSSYHQSGYEFSPDGTQFAVSEDVSVRDWSGGGGIWLVQVADGSSRPLVPPPPEGQRYWNVKWSPDGKSLAYAVMTLVETADNSGMYRRAIDIVDVATGRVRTLTTRAGTDSAEIAWAPDSGRLAFTGLRDGSATPTLTEGLEFFYPPEDIFAINADGTDEQNVSDSSGVENSTRWSPGGNEISYSFWEAGAGRLVIDQIEGTQAAGKARSWPVTGEYIWSPDGRLLLVATIEEVSPPGAQNQVLHSTLQTLETSFLEDPVTIGQHDFNVGGLAWQWLKP